MSSRIGFSISNPSEKKYGLVYKPTKPVSQAPDDEGIPQSNINKLIQKEQLNKTYKKVALDHSKVLAEDPTAFDYDSVYDSFKPETPSNTGNRKVASETKREPRYIQDIMNRAKEREREQGIIYDRKLIKERDREEDLFGDKEKFVTSAYKKKLMEDKKWQEEEAKREAANKDITKQDNLNAFYTNLLNNSLTRESPPTTARKSNSAASPPLNLSASGNNNRKPEADTAQHTNAISQTADVQSTSTSQKDKLGNASQSAMTSGDTNNNNNKNNNNNDNNNNKPNSDDNTKRAISNEVPSEISNKAQRRNDDASIASAKERYLQRKKQKELSG